MPLNKYKRYLVDSSGNIPRSTAYKRKKLLERNTNHLISNSSCSIDNSPQIKPNANQSNLNESIIINEKSNTNIEIINTINDESDVINNEYVLINHESELISRKPLEELELIAVLLTLFFDSKITQTGFASYLETTNFITNYDLPKSFKSCSNKLVREFGHNIDYVKYWYCFQCKMSSTLDN